MATPTRLIFQNFNAFVGPAALSGNSATGQLYANGNTGANLIAQLSRVQNSSLTIGLNRQDVFEQGQLARVDNIFVAPPSISMDLSYYLTNGYNEQMLGFNTKGQSFLSGLLTKVSDSKNYFISISPQGVDDDGLTNQNQRNVYALGNGFISNYSLNASVGQLATASVTIEGLNAGVFTGSSGLQTIAINPETSTRVTNWNFQLPVGDPITGANVVSALRPAEISLQFPAAAGFLVSMSGSNRVRVQSVAISVPISRETLSELGSFYGYSKEIQFPVIATMQVRAIATDITPDSFDQLLCDDQFYDLKVLMNQPGCNGTGALGIAVGFNQAKLTNWSTNNSLGSDSTIDLSFSASLGGSTSTAGVVFSGSY